MKFEKALCLIVLAFGLAGCEALNQTSDLTRDNGFDSKPLSELKAGVWIDPNGCDHWIIDDGLEGYLSQRIGRDGKPVCSGTARSNTTIGDFKKGSSVNDLL